MKNLGIIGGLGPMATACFFELITKMTDAECDQEHVRIFIDSKPQIPDRTKYILGLSDESPYPDLLEVGEELKGLGADVIGITCNTAQYFHDRLEKELGLPVIHLIRETAKYLKERGYQKVGIMATDGTIQTKLYQNELSQVGITPIVPNEEDQARVMKLIYDDVKAGYPPEMPIFNMVADNLKRSGAQVIILGCTELSVIKREKNIGSGFIDAMEVMALRCLEAVEAPVKASYKELITR